MGNVAIAVEVIESEAGWGKKTDDYMICLSVEDAKAFITEFNSKNNEPTTPSWYMYAEHTTSPVDLTDRQMSQLKERKRMWLSNLNNF